MIHFLQASLRNMEKKVELEPVQVQKWDYGSFRLDKLEICVAKKYSDIGLIGRVVFYGEVRECECLFAASEEASWWVLDFVARASIAPNSLFRFLSEPYSINPSPSEHPIF